MVSRSAQEKLLGRRLGGELVEFLGASNERREIEAKGLLDLAPLPFPRVALSVRAVAANDDAEGDEDR